MPTSRVPLLSSLPHLPTPPLPLTLLVPQDDLSAIVQHGALIPPVTGICIGHFFLKSRVCVPEIVVV